MSKGIELIFLQRNYTKSQQAQKKMFNITGHYGNSNKNHNEVLHHTHEMAIISFKKHTQIITSAGEECRETENLIHC